MAALWAHRRVVLSLVLCLVVALAAAVVLHSYGPWVEQTSSLSALVSSTPFASPALHDTYSFRVKIMSPVPAHAGEQVTFQWVPEVAGRASATSGPVPVHCTLALYGPYGSMKDLNAAQAAGDGFKPHGTPVFTAPPRTMSDWEATSQQTEVVPPKTLHAGYYEVVYQCESSRNQSNDGGGFVIQVIA